MHIPCSTFHSRELWPCAIACARTLSIWWILISNDLWPLSVWKLQNDVAWSVPTLKLVQMTGCNASATIDSQIHRVRLNSNVAARTQNTLTSQCLALAIAHSHSATDSAWVEYRYWMDGKYSANHNMHFRFHQRREPSTHVASEIRVNFNSKLAYSDETSRGKSVNWRRGCHDIRAFAFAGYRSNAKRRIKTNRFSLKTNSAISPSAVRYDGGEFHSFPYNASTVPLFRRFGVAQWAALWICGACSVHRQTHSFDS